MKVWLSRNESRPARALWIEIPNKGEVWGRIESRPARALWIEIVDITDKEGQSVVEAREGLVD